MTFDGKKPGVAFWASVVVVVVGLYGGSFGPAYWVESRVVTPEWVFEGLECVYYPLNWMTIGGPRGIRDALCWWKEAGQLVDNSPKIPPLTLEDYTQD